MAKMCPIDACSTKPGLCIHDKMMIAMAILGMFGALLYAVA